VLILLFVLIILLRIGGKSGSENQREYGGTYHYDLLHGTYLDLPLLTAACPAASIIAIFPTNFCASV
jgi:hypothetical protein